MRSFAAKAGTERVICDKINWLASNGYEVSLLTYEQGSHPLSFPLHKNVRHYDLNVRFFTLNSYPLYIRLFMLFRYKRLFSKRLQSIVDKFTPDIIITTTYSLKVASEITNLHADSIKIIESHVACGQISKVNDYKEGSVMRYIVRMYDFFNYRKVCAFDKLVVLTKGDAKQWMKYTSKIIVIPNPVTCIPISTNACKKLSHRIVAVGRLHSQKGFDLLIEAFSRISSSIPKWYIDIYGHGEDESMLRNLINIKGLEGRINLKGVTNDIYHEYKKSQFLVLSSRYEGWGLVLVEAMSCGIPCVSFRCDFGPDEIITDGEDGLLIENGDIQSLADSILWMAIHEKERKEMGYNAQIRSKNFMLDDIMKQWTVFFTELIGIKNRKKG